ncbi:MAG: shikimate kinase AroK [Pseudomonadota bacterium]|nr:shikimate kinase AroK [Pseudomonadota bacterium]
MPAINNIFLIGLMGAGKTTIGRQLAQALDKEFIDSDHEIEARTGVNIPLIFELEGEQGFREREAAVIDELTARNNVVLATGGGAVLYEENRQHLKERGTVIYLQASVEQLLERTRKDKNRPLLQTADPEARLKALLTEREPLYLELADLVVRTGQTGVRSVVESILQKLP